MSCQGCQSAPTDEFQKESREDFEKIKDIFEDMLIDEETDQYEQEIKTTDPLIKTHLKMMFSKLKNETLAMVNDLDDSMIDQQKLLKQRQLMSILEPPIPDSARMSFNLTSALAHDDSTQLIDHYHHHNAQKKSSDPELNTMIYGLENDVQRRKPRRKYKTVVPAEDLHFCHQSIDSEVKESTNPIENSANYQLEITKLSQSLKNPNEQPNVQESILQNQNDQKINSNEKIKTVKFQEKELKQQSPLQLLNKLKEVENENQVEVQIVQVVKENKHKKENQNQNENEKLVVNQKTNKKQVEIQVIDQKQLYQKQLQIIKEKAKLENVVDMSNVLEHLSQQTQIQECTPITKLEAVDAVINQQEKIKIEVQTQNKIQGDLKLADIETKPETQKFSLKKVGKKVIGYINCVELFQVELSHQNIEFNDENKIITFEQKYQIKLDQDYELKKQVLIKQLDKIKQNTIQLSAVFGSKYFKSE